MPGDNRTVCLFGHHEPKQGLTHLEVWVWLQFGRGVFCGGRARVVPNYRLSLGTLHQHSSERGERRTERKKYFGFFSHRVPPISISQSIWTLTTYGGIKSIVLLSSFNVF